MRDRQKDTAKKSERQKKIWRERGSQRETLSLRERTRTRMRKREKENEKERERE